jgi:hypothetical protein
MPGNGSLRSALALSVSALSAEHVLSATLSSPWSTAKFATSDEDRRLVWRLFTEAAIASGIFALVIGLMLRDENSHSLLAAMAGTVAIIAWVGLDYHRALSGTL